jgi:hypothetical protein
MASLTTNTKTRLAYLIQKFLKNPPRYDTPMDDSKKGSERVTRLRGGRGEEEDPSSYILLLRLRRQGNNKIARKKEYTAKSLKKFNKPHVTLHSSASHNRTAFPLYVTFPPRDKKTTLHSLEGRLQNPLDWASNALRAWNDYPNWCIFS